MKHLPLILGLVILVLLAIIFIGVTEMNDINRTQQKTIDGLREANKKEADSLTRNLKLTRDSLEVAFSTIRQARKESQEAHERTQATIRNLQRIVFIQHSDSSRNAELRNLYKSYTP